VSKLTEDQKKEIKTKIDVLAKNFEYNDDQFEKIGWYTPLVQTATNSWSRKLLGARVNSKGYVYLISQYYADDWLFHTKVQIIIDGDPTVYETADVPTYDEDNKHQNSDSIWETISYSRDRDNGILKLIAENYDKKIKVRFVGRDTISDIVLSDKDKKAIKDSYDLAQLLKQYNS
jgi:Txe/YoeB family toxin of Txe-Axe toxin-antitoxin module